MASKPANDPLSDVPLDAPDAIRNAIANLAKDPDDDDHLANVPLQLSSFDDVVNYSSNDSSGNSMVASARIPPAWGAIIDEIREYPGMPFRSVWPVRADFIRWAVFHGIKKAALYIREQAEDDPNVENMDHVIDAHVFSEQHMGMVNARNDLIVKTVKDIDKLAQVVRITVSYDEEPHAGYLVDRFIDGVQAQRDNSYRSLITKILLRHQELRAEVGALLRGGHITSEFLYDAAVIEGVIPDFRGDDEQETASNS